MNSSPQKIIEKSALHMVAKILLQVDEAHHHKDGPILTLNKVGHEQIIH